MRFRIKSPISVVTSDIASEFHQRKAFKMARSLSLSSLIAVVVLTASTFKHTIAEAKPIVVTHVAGAKIELNPESNKNVVRSTILSTSYAASAIEFYADLSNIIVVKSVALDVLANDRAYEVIAKI